MPRNQLKHFPTAILRRGMAHFHPAAPSPGPVPVRDRDPRPQHASIAADAPKTVSPLQIGSTPAD